MKRIISIIVSVLLCITAVPFNFVTYAATTTLTGLAGSGTESDPYQISNATHLLMLAEFINSGYVEGQYELARDAYFIQTADIDMKGKAWEPIGTYDSDRHYFTGHYNGNYHSIKNLTCTSDNTYVGLFGRLGENGTDYTDKCVISNLTVYGTVTGENANCTGGIAGELCSGASIINSCFIGNVSGKNNVGGIAGHTYNGGYIRNCYHNGTVSATNTWAGGIIGSLRVGNGTASVNAGVYNSYHTGGQVSAANGYIGGIVGRLENAEKTANCTIVLDNNYYLNSTCDGGYNGESTSGYQKLSEEMWGSAVELLGAPYTSDTDSTAVSACLLNHTFTSVTNHFDCTKTMSAVRHNSNPAESLLDSAAEISKRITVVIKRLEK